MIRILKPDSPLHYLPRELGGEKLMIYDSLRFTLEMIDYCYVQLLNSIENIVVQKETKIHYKVFHYAWSIVDHSQRFSKLYKTLEPPKKQCDLSFRLFG